MSLSSGLKLGDSQHHSTESALLKVTNDSLLSLDSGNHTILSFSDLSAAFGTVDHSVLLDRLQYVVGIQGPFCGLPPTSSTD